MVAVNSSKSVLFGISAPKIVLLSFSNWHCQVLSCFTVLLCFRDIVILQKKTIRVNSKFKLIM